MTDFLARERELLGGAFGAPTSSGADDIDLDRAASAFPDINFDGSDPIPAGPGSAPTFDFDDFERPVGGKTDVRVTGDDDFDRFENAFPDIGPVNGKVQSPPPNQPPTFGATPTFAPQAQPSTLNILHQAIQDEAEPEPIRQWRENQAAAIKARNDASAARRQEIISKAEGSIDQFYEDYSAKTKKNIKENKLQEAEYLQSLTDSLSAGTTWSRICDLIELQNSQSKTLARTGTGTTDLTRFKEVLLRLKREGESAPGAGGY